MKTVVIQDGTLLTSAGWVEGGYVAIRGNSIVAIGSELPGDLLPDEVISAKHCAVIPGLLNGHTHLSQTFMRGLAGGRTLLAWLKERIWPIQNAMTPEILYLAAMLGFLENVRCGVTHVVDHHKIAATPHHTDVVLKAAQETGLNFTLARSWADIGSNAESPDAIWEDMKRLYTEWHGKGNIRIADGPLTPWRCSMESLRKMHALSLDCGSFTHIHVAETQEEVQMSLRDCGSHPIAWLKQIGVLDASTQIVHAVWVGDMEIEMLASAGATVLHCPISNAVLASGVAPLAALMSRQIPVHLGTDGPASGDMQDIWEVIKSALLFSRASTLDAMAIVPGEALGLGLSAAGLRAGDVATLTVVDLNHCRAMPVYDVSSALALCTHGSDVRSVMVNGEFLIRDGQVLFLDEPALLQECRQAAQRLRKLAGF